MVLSAFVDDDLKDTLVFKSSLWWSLVGLMLLATVSVPTGSPILSKWGFSGLSVSDHPQGGSRRP